MKKKYIHTRFINYLLEKHKEELEEEEELQQLPDDDEDEETPINEEPPQNEEDDEVIDKLLTEYRKTKREYENLRNRERK